MKKIFLILLSVLLLVSCEKQSDLVTTMKIDNVDWTREYIPSGSKLQIRIYAVSQVSPVNRMILSASDIEYNDREIKDSTLSLPAKKAEITLYYTLPYYQDSTIVTLKARSYDQDGNTNMYPLFLHVTPDAAKLRTIDAVTMYSAASEGKSAFSFESMQPVYLGKDSSSVAFFDLLTEASQAALSPSCIWQSESGILFSRSEGFNFSEATAQSVRSAWPNHIKSGTIKDIKADDVILIGKSDQAIGVAKIIAVFDESGTANDRYSFSLKVIETK